jgi:hypothetical protein
MNNLGNVYEERGKYAQAETHCNILSADLAQKQNGGSYGPDSPLEVRARLSGSPSPVTSLEVADTSDSP